MPKLAQPIEKLFTARILSIALVVEVGFIVGVYVGRMEQLNPVQWAGAASALLGAALLAAMVHAWRDMQPKKPEPVRIRQER